MNHADQMALTAYRALDEKKGRDIRIMSSPTTLSSWTAAAPAR